MYLLLAYFLNVVNNSNTKDLNYYIAEYILEHLAGFESVTLQDIADGCYVSVPTVKQFIRRFDYSNYAELKKRILSERGSRLDQIRQGYAEFDPELTRRIAEAVSSSVPASFEVLDTIVEEIIRCGRVIVIGSPTIVPVLTNFQTDLCVMGRPVLLSSQIRGNIVDFQPDDLILMISGTGRLFLSEDHLHAMLGRCRNPIVIFSGDTEVQMMYNIVGRVDLITDNEMFATEYLLLAYFDVLRWRFYQRVLEGDGHA